MRIQDITGLNIYFIITLGNSPKTNVPIDKTDIGTFIEKGTSFICPPPIFSGPKKTECPTFMKDAKVIADTTTATTVTISTLPCDALS